MPLPATHSHLAVLHKLSSELAARGHQILLLVPPCDLQPAQRLGTPKGLEVAAFATAHTRADTMNAFREQRFRPGLQSVLLFARLMQQVCLDLLGDETMRKGILAFNATMILGDMNNVCGFSWSEIYGLPQLPVSALPMMDPIHAPFTNLPNPLAWQPQFGTGLTPEMTFVQRLKNVGMYLATQLLTPTVEEEVAGEIRRRYGVKRPNDAESLQQQPLYIYNVDFSLEFPRPLPPVINFVGPLLTGPARPLPESLQAYMDSASDDCVVYASLGTAAAVGADEFQAMAAALSALPWRVVWKLADGDLPEGMTLKDLDIQENVKVVQWAPQNDILGHPNLKAFLTHAGVNSLYEAAYHAVPIVSIPMIADQPDNAAKAVYHRFGLVVQPAEISKANIVSALMRVLQEPAFKEAAARVAKRLHAPGPTSAQKAADLVERVLATGAESYLRTPDNITQIPFHKRYLLDVLALVGAVSVGLVGTCFLLLRWAWRRVSARFRTDRRKLD
ncbi:hypothetical protein WJX72_007391 [[Myrmecia] bisecta]|uniref:Glycosyltransferase n=1 Tax=[Myrmecia] bisecta TaxID=41462 RepID=A0AAW1QFS7_9CHLO